MPRKEKESMITIENKRKHVVRLSSEVSIQPLENVTISEKDYTTILEENDFVRRAISQKFLKAKRTK